MATGWRAAALQVRSHLNTALEAAATVLCRFAQMHHDDVMTVDFFLTPGSGWGQVRQPDPRLPQKSGQGSGWGETQRSLPRRAPALSGDFGEFTRESHLRAINEKTAA